MEDIALDESFNEKEVLNDMKVEDIAPTWTNEMKEEIAQLKNEIREIKVNIENKLDVVSKSLRVNFACFFSFLLRFYFILF